MQNPERTIRICLARSRTSRIVNFGSGGAGAETVGLRGASRMLQTSQ